MARVVAHQARERQRDDVGVMQLLEARYARQLQPEAVGELNVLGVQ